MKRWILILVVLPVIGFAWLGDTPYPPPTLIAHYKMNDNLATDVIIDETGNHNGAVKDAGGTATSAFHSVAGKINLAQEFDGGDDYIEIPDHTDYTPALTPFSISAWVYMHDASNFKIASKGFYNTDGEWKIELDGADKVQIIFMDESVNSCRIGSKYNTALTSYQNQWIHLAATYNGGTSYTGVKLYLNAVRVDDTDAGTNPGSFVAVENLNHAIWIGRYDTIEANGTIDNVMFFSQVLDKADITFLYNRGNGREDWETYFLGKSN